MRLPPFPQWIPFIVVSEDIRCGTVWVSWRVVYMHISPSLNDSESVILRADGRVM